MNTTAPTFAKQDSLKVFRTLNSVNNYLRKQYSKKQETETIYENNNFVFCFSCTLFFILTLDAFLGTSFADNCYGNWNGWSRNECDA
jgi:linoleoyl-CoA desaturase